MAKETIVLAGKPNHWTLEEVLAMKERVHQSPAAFLESAKHLVRPEILQLLQELLMTTDPALNTASEFKAFFEAIPEDQWTTDSFHSWKGETECWCALGHLSVLSDKTEGDKDRLNNRLAVRLDAIFSKVFDGVLGRRMVPSINDGNHPKFAALTHPKTRILAALDLCVAKGL